MARTVVSSSGVNFRIHMERVNEAGALRKRQSGR